MAQTTAPADSIPGPDVGLGLLLETGGADNYRWTNARGELSEILAKSKRRKAAIRDTVSVLNTAYRDSLSARDQVESDLRTDLRWARWDLDRALDNQHSWLDKLGFALGVAAGMLFTLLAVDYTVG